MRKTTREKKAIKIDGSNAATEKKAIYLRFVLELIFFWVLSLINFLIFKIMKIKKIKTTIKSTNSNFSKFYELTQYRL